MVRTGGQVGGRGNRHEDMIVDYICYITFEKKCLAVQDYGLIYTR